MSSFGASKRFYAVAVTNCKNGSHQMNSIEGKYANALFNATIKTNSVELVHKDLQRIHSIFEDNPAYKNVLQNPSISVSSKLNWLKENVIKTDNQIVNGFFKTLGSNSRLNFALQAIKSFDLLVKAHKNIVQVQVVSAQKLDDSYIQKLKEILESHVIPGTKNINYTLTVDPSLLGGVVVHVGDKSIDMSVSSRLGKIKSSIDQWI